VQDAYLALRCAARRSRGAARADAPPPTPTGLRTAELRSAIDNPMVLPDGRVESCRQLPRRGRWRSPVADLLAIAGRRTWASIAERRTDRLLRRDALARPAAVPGGGWRESTRG